MEYCGSRPPCSNALIISQSINQSINQSISQSVSQSVNQPISQILAINNPKYFQSVGRSICQLINYQQLQINSLIQ